MFFSFKNAASVFPQFGFVFSFNTAFVAVMFYVAMYCEPKQVTGKILVAVLGISFAIGLAMGLYLKFRAEFSSSYAMIGSAYFVFFMEILFGSSLVAFSMLQSGRSDLRWFAFNTNTACVLLAMLIGMLLEAGRLGVMKGEDLWREEIGKYLDFSKRLVEPTLTTKPPTMSTKDMLWIGAAAGVNIPLLFQIYGGGRDNAIFLAAPLLTLTFFYLNYKTFGPGLIRILLLRKIEKEKGYRFQNADYEKIQELRRGFFMARWLMKDYRTPVGKIK